MKTNQTAKALTLAALILCAAGAAFADEPPAPPATPPQAPAAPLGSSTPELETSAPPGPELAPLFGIAPVGFPIKFSGYFWDDTGYAKFTNALSGDPTRGQAYMQGRFVLSATYGRELGDFAAAARVELMGLVNEFSHFAYEPHTLDAYVLLGQKKWDFQIGRFLAWEVYYRGQGIELYTAEEAGASKAPALYLLDFARGLINGGPGQAALHFYPTDWLSFELASVFGQDNSGNHYGVRPVASIKLGRFAMVAGAEAAWLRPQSDAQTSLQTQEGYAARVQYSLPVVTVGADASRASQVNRCLKLFCGTPDDNRDTTQTWDKTSVGGWADIDFWRNSIGLGYHFTTQTDLHGNTDNQHQMFVSYLYRFPFEGLSIKAVAGYARAHFEDIDLNSQWENDLTSIRVRLLYVFH